MKIPYLQVRNNALLYYELSTVQPARFFKEGITKAYSGKVTEGAKKRLQKAIDILVQKSPPRMTYNPVSQKTFPFRINFITLTFSCSRFINGKEGHMNMIKPFLRILRRRQKFSYVWKAEFQGEENHKGEKKKEGGQLHYHIASNMFIPWQEMRKQWNRLQRKNGYLVEYGLKNGHYNANSTDVHSVYAINDIAAYLGKYMSKEQGKKLDGKIWDSSKDCKENRFSTEPVYEQAQKIRQAVKDKKIEQIDLEHCTIFKTQNPLDYLTVTQFKHYTAWRDNKIIKIKPVMKNQIKPLTNAQQIQKLKIEQSDLQGCYFLWVVDDFARMKEINKQLDRLEKKEEKEKKKRRKENKLFWQV